MFESDDAFSRLLKKKRVFFGGWIRGEGAGLYIYPYEQIMITKSLVGHKLSYESCRPIRYLHISHNAPYLPPKILQKHCFQFPLRRLLYPGEMKNKGYAIFYGANKVHYRKCGSGVLTAFL